MFGLGSRLLVGCLVLWEESRFLGRLPLWVDMVCITTHFVRRITSYIPKQGLTCRNSRVGIRLEGGCIFVCHLDEVWICKLNEDVMFQIGRLELVRERL